MTLLSFNSFSSTKLQQAGAVYILIQSAYAIQRFPIIARQEVLLYPSISFLVFTASHVDSIQCNAVGE